VTIAMCVAACSVAAFDYGVLADNAIQQERFRLHFEIVAGQVAAPTRYRVLVPYAIHPFIVACARLTDLRSALKKVYDVYYVLALSLLLWVLTVYLREWFPLDAALLGAVFVAAVVPIALRQHSLAPGSLLEPSLVTLALLGAHRRWTTAIIPLTVVASLNRETGILCTASPDRRVLQSGAIAVCLSVGLFFALRLWLGAAPPAVTLSQVWAINLQREGFLAALGNITLFMGGVGWILAAVGFRAAPPFTRRALAVAALYLPVVALWGVWYEVRLLMPLYPVLLPFVLSAVHRPSSST
jgi:hypothetical protein